MPTKHWNHSTAFQQLESCAYTCEGGALENNAAYVWLKNAAAVGPEFWPGQGVWYEVEATVSGVKLNKWAHFYIIGCDMASDTERRFWTFTLSNDPPAPYHYGEVSFRNVPGNKLRLANPAEDNRDAKCDARKPNHADT